ncbi:ABC transporter permease [Staphylococcus argenteus]|uniref:ABC transporter permease n=1 Tax=Staphylococcus argenteus TaxID=985002 RepID=UPI001FB974FC|nr:ABC transporter permease [Staphylococcus argenteus]GJF54938.1 MFS transporter [Staphylococcus argenteus]GJF60846.1 MFS transporter [Staphylococcus argenteus]GJG20776.1 MFS transporter [Staphylococcus argenteus]GJG22906.1 MFS transporter [Staphylococcus argenteus]
MVKNTEIILIWIGIIIQIAYVAVISLLIYIFTLFFGSLFGFLHLLTGNHIEDLLTTPITFIIFATCLIIFSSIPVIVMAFDLSKGRIIKGIILVVYAIIALLINNFVSAILWFIAAILLFVRKESSAAKDTVIVQSRKGTSEQAIRYKLIYKSSSTKHSDDSIKAAHTDENKKIFDNKTIDIHLDSSEILTKINTDSNQALHTEDTRTELESKDMSEPTEFKNVATKNNEGSKQEIHTAGAESKSDSDDTEPPIESKNHSSKKD